MGKEGDQIAKGKYTQELFLKEARLGLIQELAVFAAKRSPWIEKILSLMIFDMDHAFSLQFAWSFALFVPKYRAKSKLECIYS